MAVTDTVADLLTRIRNAQKAQHRYVDVRFSKLNQNIISVLQEAGYVIRYLVNDRQYQIRVFLKYVKSTREGVIHGLRRMSTPGLRRYVKHGEIPRVFSGLGIAIVSTPLGVLEGEKARAQKAGGELLCLVW